MKNLLIALTVLTSITTFANELSYDCTNSHAVDVGLPTNLFVQIENDGDVSLQNSSNDLYYDGMLADRCKRKNCTAIGFTGLYLSDGHVLISKTMLNGKKKASLTIVDGALDSTHNKYSCKKL